MNRKFKGDWLFSIEQFWFIYQYTYLTLGIRHTIKEDIAVLAESNEVECAYHALWNYNDNDNNILLLERWIKDAIVASYPLFLKEIFVKINKYNYFRKHYLNKGEIKFLCNDGVLCAMKGTFTFNVNDKNAQKINVISKRFKHVLQWS